MFGIVYNPILDQLWTAKKGFGAEHNGKKVNVSCFNNDIKNVFNRSASQAAPPWTLLS